MSPFVGHIYISVAFCSIHCPVFFLWWAAVRCSWRMEYPYSYPIAPCPILNSAEFTEKMCETLYWNESTGTEDLWWLDSDTEVDWRCLFHVTCLHDWMRCNVSVRYLVCVNTYKFFSLCLREIVNAMLLLPLVLRAAADFTPGQWSNLGQRFLGPDATVLTLTRTCYLLRSVPTE